MTFILKIAPNIWLMLVLCALVPTVASAQSSVDPQCLAENLGYYAKKADGYQDSPHLGSVLTMAMTADGILEWGQRFMNTTKADAYDETYITFRYLPVTCNRSGVVLATQTLKVIGGQHLPMATQHRTNLLDHREFRCHGLSAKGLGTKVFGPSGTPKFVNEAPSEDLQHTSIVCRAMANVDRNFAPSAPEAGVLEQSLNDLLTNRDFAATRFSSDMINSFNDSLARAYALSGQFKEAAAAQETIVAYWKAEDSKVEVRKASDRLRAYKRKKMPEI